MLEQIIPSRTRRKILKLFFTNLGKTYHLRRVGREVEEEINAVKRELDILTGAQVLRKEKRINKIIYSLNDKYIFFEEFLSIFTKESDFIKKIFKNVAKLGKIKYFVISKKFARRDKILEGEVYMLFVGLIVSAEIVSLVAEEEKDHGSEINYTIMTEEEFKFRKKNADPFIWGFLKKPHIVMIGNEEELTA